MTKTEILIRRLRCEANNNCPHTGSGCPAGCPGFLPEDLQDYDWRNVCGEAADKIEELIAQIEAFKSNTPITFTNSGIYLGAPIFTKSECSNIVDFIELNLFDIIRNDNEIDNLEWLRSMLSIHAKAMNVIGKKWDDEKECWVSA